MEHSPCNLADDDDDAASPSCMFVLLQLTNVSDLVSQNHVGSNNNNFTKATIASPVRSRATTDAHFMPGHRYSICTGFFPSSSSTCGGEIWWDEFNATILCWTDSIEGLVGATW